MFLKQNKIHIKILAKMGKKVKVTIMLTPMAQYLRIVRIQSMLRALKAP